MRVGVRGRGPELGVRGLGVGSERWFRISGASGLGVSGRVGRGRPRACPRRYGPYGKRQGAHRKAHSSPRPSGPFAACPTRAPWNLQEGICHDMNFMTRLSGCALHSTAARTVRVACGYAHRQHHPAVSSLPSALAYAVSGVKCAHPRPSAASRCVAAPCLPSRAQPPKQFE